MTSLFEFDLTQPVAHAIAVLSFVSVSSLKVFDCDSTPARLIYCAGFFHYFNDDFFNNEAASAITTVPNSDGN